MPGDQLIFVASYSVEESVQRVARILRATANGEQIEIDIHRPLLHQRVLMAQSTSPRLCSQSSLSAASPSLPPNKRSSPLRWFRSFLPTESLRPAPEKPLEKVDSFSPAVQVPFRLVLSGTAPFRI
mmetsp:Transcript_26702/g.67929  ORF Transcript_26702/g.67929 Transcript_26702/m.67929 type:complete len:126 (+) Transcript_26702:471-848(+)